MKVFLKIIMVITAMFISLHAFSQEFMGADAKRLIANAQHIKLDEATQFVEYVRFDHGKEITIFELNLFFKESLGFSNEMSWILLNTIQDQKGDVHNRYRLLYQGILLHDGMFITHETNGKIYAINGFLPNKFVVANSAKLTEIEALKIALSKVSAQIYKWELKSEEEFIKNLMDDPNATWFPKGELKLKFNKKEQTYSYAWVFDIYAHQPMSRADYFIDATTGELIFVNNKIKHGDSLGTAITKFSGSKPITTDFNNNSFRLRETGRGNGIETYNMQTSTNYGNAVDFADMDNYWNNVNAQKDEVATDAHWGMEMTYDYFYTRYNRNSIDGNGFKLRSYVHYDVAYANAFWNGQYMTFGDGNSSWQPLVALDIVAHEISHGLTTFTADLDYQDESGAMNEAYSDIFGTAIEHYGKNGNWTIGEDIGSAMRSMSNPKSKGDPDTYLGQNYYIGTADNGGVHTNSGVLNHWFYLTSEGGQGVNDNSDSYNVVGVGIDTAGAIAFRALSVYLVNTSDHAEGRFYSILSAIDLYGPCSSPVKATTSAFYAVGIGSDYVDGVQSDFYAEIVDFCNPPATVTFKNLSNNATNYSWNFGDGNSSSAINPTHSFVGFGSFNVQLIADGGSCGSDTTTKIAYISVDTANPCLTILPNNGFTTINNCNGVVLDNGGLAPYTTNTNSTVVIAPYGASNVILTFTSFSFEDGYDFLKIYDGPNAQSPLIGSFTGNGLPGGGVIQSTGGAITLVQTTDQAVNNDGFVANFQCVLPTEAPTSSFLVSDSISCSGVIGFMDKSTNGPIAWEWDFGDGNTSTLRNPTHSYQFNGVYSVTLKSTNVVGNHTINKVNCVVVDKLFAPAIPSVSVCNSGNITFLANHNSLADVYWYDNQIGTSPIHIGDTLNLGSVSSSQTYFAELVRKSPVLTAGRPTNGGGGGNLTATHGLYFDAYQPFVLHSVNVYATAAGSRTINLRRNNGLLLDSKTVAVIAGLNTVILDFNIPAENDLLLEGSNLYRNNNSVSFPYTLPNYLSINRSTAGTAPLDYYYYFYNWQVHKPNCVSDRVEVNAFVNNANPVANFSVVNNDPYFDFNDISTNKGAVEWSFGDGQISYLNSTSHLYLQNGVYQVTMSVDNGCGTDSKTQTISVNSATSIGLENENSSLSIYPNPANQVLNVRLNGDFTEGKIEIYNLAGQKLFELFVSNSQEILTLPIDNLSSGLYFIQFDFYQSREILKFIKE